LPEITCSIIDTPTTLSGTSPQDNIVFDRRATSEFTGRAGVLDLMREFDLTWREASNISEHLPVWAEFTPTEGGNLGRMASRTGRKAPQ
jgi:deoxyribonuclease-1-like protein